MKLTKRQEEERAWINTFIMREIDDKDLNNLSIEFTNALLTREKRIKELERLLKR